MNVIKTVGAAQKTREDAEDVVAGAVEIPGILFAYADRDNRVVTFATDFYPDSPLLPGQERLNLVFRESEKQESKETKQFMVDLGNALMGRGPLAR
jgi:hypothetical protein